MRGVITEFGKKGASLKVFPDPIPGTGQVLLRVKAAGLCGSDLQMYRGEHSADVVKAGQHIIGHEAAGLVVDTGPGVAAISPGDRVSVYHLTGCGSCRYCRQELYQFCEKTRKSIGFHLHGGDADFLCCNAEYMVPLPPSVSFEDGSVAACVGGTAFSALGKGEACEGKVVVVFGLGPVGLSVALLATKMGASVIGVDLIDTRLQLGLQIGCQAVIDVRKEDPVTAILELTDGLGTPIVVECSGSLDAQKAAIHAAAIRGRVILVGHNHKLTIDPSKQLMIRRELNLMGSWVFSRADLIDLLSFMDRQHISFEPIITHRFPLSEAAEAFSLFDRRETGKVILIP